MAWRDVHFDHDKTAYPLRDKHVDVPCVQCHFGNRYKGTPQQCASCHTPDDVHHGERGSEVRRLSLDGRLEEDEVRSRERNGLRTRRRARAHRLPGLPPLRAISRTSCHATAMAAIAARTSHAERLGIDCGKCHDNEKWQTPTFDHTRDTKWPLEGRHAKVDCHACHTAPTVTQKLATDCIGCHRASDAHSGKLGTDCASCHTAGRLAVPACASTMT